MKLKSVVEKASGAQTERQRLSRQAEFKIVEKRLFWLTEEKTAANGRFGEIGGEVTVRISVRTLTTSPCLSDACHSHKSLIITG